jgi:hypothetical protein
MKKTVDLQQKHQNNIDLINIYFDVKLFNLAPGLTFYDIYKVCSKQDSINHFFSKNEIRVKNREKERLL